MGQLGQNRLLAANMKREMKQRIDDTGLIQSLFMIKIVSV